MAYRTRMFPYHVSFSQWLKVCDLFNKICIYVFPLLAHHICSRLSSAESAHSIPAVFRYFAHIIFCVSSQTTKYQGRSCNVAITPLFYFAYLI